MTIADIVYGKLIHDVEMFGEWDRDTPVRAVWKDGTPAYTKSLLNVQMKFDNGKEIPILSQKRVPQKDPVNEAFWIWRDKSNDVQALRDMGCKVWDEWTKEDGTIGKAYGWQLRNKMRKVKITDELLEMVKNGELSLSHEIEHVYESMVEFKGHSIELDQVDYLIYTLKTNPSSRRIKTTLWCVEDLDDMALEPCVYDTHWQLLGGKLHLTVNVRSNDLGLGNPYNVYQYSILHRLIAQVTGHTVGTICFNIDNAHIYDRHIDDLLEQVDKPMHDAPKVWINPEITSFYDFTIDDIKLIDYTHEKSIRMEVAI